MKRFVVVFIALMAIAASCKRDQPTTDAVYDDTPYTFGYGNFPPPNLATDNMPTVQKVALGRMLFYENKLSGDGSMSCASCHRQEHAFTDTSKFSLGILGFDGKRQAMSAFNLAWNKDGFFWDGRAFTLRQQSLMPIQDSLEMHETLPNVVSKLAADKKYQDQFIRAFGSTEITSEKVSLALEQFMQTIVSVNSKYDRFLAGNETLTPSEDRGRELFFGEYNYFFPDSSGADCSHCHSGLNFGPGRFANNGLTPFTENPDIGLESVTGKPTDRSKFKIVSLRNIALTAPYMHDGRFATLEEVIDHYNSGLFNSPTLDFTLQQTLQTGLRLTAQNKADLKAFLLTLTDDDLLTNPNYSSPF